MDVAEWTPKPWGRTRTLHADQRLSIHEIEVVPGGFCSVHRHACKHNTFLVLDGELAVIEFASPDDGLGPQSVIALHPGGDVTASVSVHVLHQFWSLRGARVLEIYEPDGDVPPQQHDIERFTEGGVDPGSPDRLTPRAKRLEAKA